ncbi:MAG TPA: APC family permease [Candidatus Saccharimonadales bacterium]|nr:APC family permease [Candidatus Saccharimonadales bacterium]
MAKVSFVREATGLVRDFTWFDAFLIGTSVILPGIYGYSSVIGFIAGADPGANFVLSAELAFLFMIPLGLTYVLLTWVMPRSGGDYVWVTRVAHPVIGFMVAWGLWLSLLAILGIDGYLFSTLILPISLVSFGYSTGNVGLIALASAVTSPVTAYVLGLLMILISFLIIIPGPRVFSRLMAIMFAIVMVGTLVSFGLLMSYSHTDFINSFNQMVGPNVSYNSIINQAQSAGWSFAPISWGATLLSIPLSIVVYNGFNYASAAAGEIRNVKRSIPIAIFGSLLFALILTIVGTQLAVNVLGYDFIQASFSLGANWPLPAPPWAPIFMTMLNPNIGVVFLIQLAWLVSFFWNTAGFLLVATRYVFAFAFDGVLPVRFADVGDRFHFPTKAAVLNFIIAAIFLLLATFTPWLGLFLNAVAIWSIVWVLTSLVAIILPLKKKELMSSLPGGTWKIPLVSIVGVISLILMIATFYFSVTTPALGPSTLQADMILSGIFLSGLIVYVASYYDHKKKGANLSMVYSEIPPE